MTPIDRSNYPGIPEDFPIEPQTVALTGAQPKLSLVQHGEDYYATGTSPQEVQEDYEEMVDLANQVMVFVRKNAFTTQEALDAFLQREAMVMQMNYGIRAIHTEWVMKRVRLLLREAGHPASMDSDGPSSKEAR